MQLTFLGTSAGKPTKERNVSATALQFGQDGKWYLFDCGEGTQHRLLEAPLSVGKLAAIFITHLHGDHLYGLPGLLASKSLDGALRPLTLYGPKGIRRFVECVTNLSHETLGYELRIIEFEAGETFAFDRFTLTVLPLLHSVESFAFHLKEHDISNRLDEPKLRAAGLEPSPLYGELKRGRQVAFGGKVFEPADYMLAPRPGRRIIVAGDNADPAVLGDDLNDLDLLVHECTYTQTVYDALKQKLLHTTALQLGKTAQRFGVKNLIATHISARYGRDGIEAIAEEIGRYYKGRFFIANDFDRFGLHRGVVKKDNAAGTACTPKD